MEKVEYETYEEKCPKDNWKAKGKNKETDVRRMMKQLVVRQREFENDAERVLWAIKRYHKTIFLVVTPFDIKSSQVVEDARMLRMPGFKQAFEKTYNMRISQDYLDEVGYTASQPMYMKGHTDEQATNSEI